MQGTFRVWLGGALVAALSAAAPAFAADTQHSYAIPDPHQTIPGQPVSNSVSTMSIEARVSALEGALAEKDDEPEWEDVSEQDWSGKIGGRIMGDYVMWAHQDAQNLGAIGDQENYFEFRRLRLFASGSGYGVYDYKFQVEFEPEGIDEDGNVDDAGVAIKDMYVGIHEIPVLGYVRFGHFKAPMSLEELTSSKFITFMERSVPTILVPGRNVGVCSYNNFRGDAIHLSYGAFFNDISPAQKERVDDAQGIEFAIRGVWTPVHTANGRGLIHLGGGYRYVDDRDDSVRFRSRPEVHEGSHYIDTDDMAAGDYNVLNAELAGVYGPLSLQSEVYVTRVNNTVGGDTDLYGAYVYGSYFLTGESRNYKRKSAIFGRVKPHTNFWVVRTSHGPAAGWGAWELAARWSYLDLSDCGAGQLNDVTSGVNWYWNPHTRIMLNWIHPFGSDEAAGAGDADILAMRMQVDF